MALLTWAPRRRIANLAPALNILICRNFTIPIIFGSSEQRRGNSEKAFGFYDFVFAAVTKAEKQRFAHKLNEARNWFPLSVLMAHVQRWMWGFAGDVDAMLSMKCEKAISNLFTTKPYQPDSLKVSLAITVVMFFLLLFFLPFSAAQMMAMAKGGREINIKSVA